MDKRSILGFVLIAVILMGWLYYSNSLQNNPNPQIQRDTTSKVQETQPTDTSSQLTPDTLSSADTTLNIDSLKQAAEYIDEYGAMLYANSSKYTEKTGGAPEKIITIENSKVTMEFSNYGGTIRKFITKEYKTWEGNPVQLVDWKSGKELHMFFTSKEGKSISTEDLVFNSDYTNWQTVDIQNNKDFQLRYSLFVNGDSAQKIVKVYTFKPDSYEFDVTFELYNSDQFITGSKYQVVWGTSLNLTEYRSDDEATFSEAFAYMGGELVTFNTDEFDTLMTEDLNGYTDYVSSRNKYFGVFLIPNGPDGRKGDGAYLSGNKFHLPDEGSREEYSIAVKMDIKNDKVDKANFIILLSPIDYQILKSYNLDLQLTMRFAFDFMIRPIAQYFILPIFNFLHSFIPNYGLVIIAA